MSRYVALLRGINVGGKNLVRMADLRACFEEGGYPDARTYIQSGNVVFSAARASTAELAERIEAMLADALGLPVGVVIRSLPAMREVVAGAPLRFGDEPHRYRYDVVFLKEPLDATEAMTAITLRDGVDRAFAGSGVLYFSRLSARASESRMSRLVSHPFYRSMTIRNWNTTVQLLELLEEASPRATRSPS